MSSGEIKTLEELDSLDEKALVRGYFAGRSGDANYSETDKAYWHGYLNGLVDSGKSSPSGAQRQLAAEYVRRGVLG